MFAKTSARLSGKVFKDEWNIDFDGTNENINLNAASSLNWEEPYFNHQQHSFVFWVKFPGPSSDDRVLLDLRDTTNDGTVIQFTNTAPPSDSASLTYQINDASPLTIDDFSPDYKDVWTHIVCTYSSNQKQRIFINGILKKTSSDINKTISHDLLGKIGGKDFSPLGDYFIGQISEIAGYNFKLNARQVQTVYNNREPFDHNDWSQSHNLTYWCRMGDGQNPETNRTGFGSILAEWARRPYNYTPGASGTRDLFMIGTDSSPKNQRHVVANIGNSDYKNDNNY